MHSFMCPESLPFSFELKLKARWHACIKFIFFNLFFYSLLHSVLTDLTENWMGKPNTSPIQAGKRGPRKEVEAGATNPMEMWTKDTVFLSATSHMMWNGKPSKTWWKKKVRCWIKDWLSHLWTKSCSIQGHFVWPLQLWRAFGNLCRDLSC